jgi:hypothetical protein
MMERDEILNEMRVECSRSTIMQCQAGKALIYSEDFHIKNGHVGRESFPQSRNICVLVTPCLIFE